MRMPQLPEHVVELILEFVNARCVVCRARIHPLHVRHVRVWWWDEIGRIVEYHCSRACAYRATSIKAW